MRFSTLLISLVAAAVLSVSAATTFVVQLGTAGPAILPSGAAFHSSDPLPAWNFYKFYPYKLDINVGDTISFEITAGQTDLLHTVNFNPPVPQGDGTFGPFEPVGFPLANISLSFPPTSLLNINPALGNLQPGTGIARLKAVHNSTAKIASGFFAAFQSIVPNAPAKFEVTFTEVGSFTGYCAPHSANGMHIGVNVRPVDTAYPKNATVIANEALAEMARDKATAAWRNRMYAIDYNYLPTIPKEWFGSTPSTVSNSSKQYYVRVGIESPLVGGGAALTRFVPDHIEIYVGDVVHFYAYDADVHTVTITNGSYNGDTSIGPTIWRDFPSTPSTIDKPFRMKDYAHSGIMLGEQFQGPPFWQASPFSVQFTQAGTFHLDCLIHAEMGMEGVIHVRPAPEQACTPQQSVVNINFANMFARN